MTSGTTVRAPHGVAAILFVLVWLSPVWFGSWALNPNNATRLFGALAIAERGEATIDRYQTLTIDKAKFGDHYYMDKAPGTSLMAAPVFWATKVATGAVSYDQVIDTNSRALSAFLQLRLRLAVMLGAALLTACAAVLLLDLGTGITGDPAAGLFAATGYALGSTIWGWSATLLGHAPVAALLLIATWAIWRGTSGGEKEFSRWRYPVMAGGALGWAAVIEFPAALGGVAIGVWAIWRTRDLDWGRRGPLFAIALGTAIIALLPLIAYNLFAFGTPFKLGYQGVVGFGGMNEGLFGLTYPKPAVLFSILFGVRRGMIWVAPVLALGAVGLDRMIRTRESRDLGLVAVAVIAVVLLVNASYAYWDGGASIGPRHSVPAMPFLAIGLAPFWVMLRPGWERIAATAVLLVSIAINLMIASTDVFGSEAFANPLWDRTIRGMFLPGNLRTLPTDYWPVSPWVGLFLYLDIALPLAVLMLWWTRRAVRLAL